MSGSTSIEARVAERLQRIDALDVGVRSLVLVDADGALAAAHDLDRRRLDGEDVGPLAGACLVVKDNVDVAGQPTACASRAHDGSPAADDAPAVARLRAAGAVVLGRANMDELAMGASTATSSHGPTRNPWDVGRSPGGSSGGCAAAVALGLADLALGTDTGGSVREPASQCGVWGLAPSPGAVLAAGVVPFDPSCDRVGPLAADADLLAAATAVVSDRAVLEGSAAAGRRIGVVDELCGGPNQPGVLAVLDETLERWRAAGATVVRASVPDARAALDAYLALTSVAALPWLGPWAATGRAGAEVDRRIALGRRLLGDDEALVAAQGVRDRLRAQVADALRDVEVLVSPTMPTTAPLLAPEGPPTAQVADPLRAPYTDCWTVVANLADVPALSVPAGRSPDDGLPVGVMLMGRPGSDADLVTTGRQVAVDLRPPPAPG